MDIVSKIEITKNLHIEVVMLIKKATVIVLKPKPKYPKVALNRVFKIMCIMFAIRAKLMEIKAVNAQPIFSKGGNDYNVIKEAKINYIN